MFTSKKKEKKINVQYVVNIIGRRLIVYNR